MKNLNPPGSIAELQRGDLAYLKAGAGAPLVLMHTIRTQLDYFRKVIPAWPSITPCTQSICLASAIHR